MTDEIFDILFFTLRLAFRVCFACAVQLSVNSPHFRCSVATRGRWLRCRTVRF